MRYYRIDLTDAKGNPVYLKSLIGQPLTSLTPQGGFNPGALQVELNIPLYPTALGGGRDLRQGVGHRPGRHHASS